MDMWVRIYYAACLLVVIFKVTDALDLRYSCGSLSEPWIKLTATIDKDDPQRVMDTFSSKWNATNYDQKCLRETSSSVGATLTLEMKRDDFELCGVLLMDNNTVGEVFVRLMVEKRRFSSSQNKFYNVTCEFGKNSVVTLSASTTINVAGDCTTGQFLCPRTRSCVDVKYRCVDGYEDKKCKNDNGLEEGCNKNSDGTFNAERHVVKGKTDFIEYRGFTYSLSGSTAKIADINSASMNSTLMAARPSYQRLTASTCTYAELKSFTDFFNSVEERSTCYNFFQGLQTLLSKSCETLRTKPEGDRNQYFHVLLVTSKDVRCSFDKIASSACTQWDLRVCFIIAVASILNLIYV